MAAFLAALSAVFFALAAALQQRGQFSLARSGKAVKGAAQLVRLLTVPVWLLGTLVLFAGMEPRVRHWTAASSWSSSRCW